jgi:hypothetical protein
MFRKNVIIVYFTAGDILPDQENAEASSTEGKKIPRTDPLTYVPPIPNETHLFGAKKREKYKGALRSAIVRRIPLEIQVLAKRRQEEVKMAEVREHKMSAQCLWKRN